MRYDFETWMDRSHSGSVKWELAYRSGKTLPEGIVPFSVADMEFKNPPEVTAAMKEYLDHCIPGYTEPTDSYWKSVTEWMRKHHHWEVSKEEIVTTPSVVCALGFGVQAFTEPGDKVLIMTPVYMPFYRVIRQNGRIIEESPLILTEDGRYHIDFEDLRRRAMDPAVKLLILCSPHNPVGRVFERDELERIGEICLEAGIYIISDEIHFDLIMPGYQHTVLASLSDALNDITMTCTSPSKTFNLAGMQLSNIVIHNPAMRKRFRDVAARQNITSSNALSYVACEAAYTQGGEWLEELLQILDKNRQIVEDYIDSNMPLVKVTPLEGTYLLWLDFRKVCGDKKRLEETMQEKGLFMDEGYLFGKAGEGFERMMLACPAQVIRKALPLMKQVYDQLLEEGIRGDADGTGTLGASDAVQGTGSADVCAGMCRCRRSGRIL